MTDSDLLKEPPSNLSQCHQLIEEQQNQIEKLLSRILVLEEQVQQFTRDKYGRKSEKLHLEPEQNQSKQAESEQSEQFDIIMNEKKKNKRPRERLYSSTNLVIEEEIKIHVLDEEAIKCPKCNVPRILMDTEVYSEYEFIPARRKKITHKQRTYCCKGCGGQIITAKRDSIPLATKGGPTPSMTAYLITSKIQDHLPLYRLEDILSRSGMKIARSTMCSWLKASANCLRVIYDLMKERVLNSKVIQADETTIKYLLKGSHQAQTGFSWSYLGDSNNPYVICEFQTNRRGINPSKFLANFHGYLQTDAYTGYNRIAISNGIIQLFCMAHARRKFENALPNHKELATEALKIIAKLYDIERSIKMLSDEEKFNIRQKESMPVLREFKKWLELNLPSVVPTSSIYNAINYSLKNIEKLFVYTEQGYLSIDNNRAERSQKEAALGRKNWLFIGNEAAGFVYEVLATIVNSCKINGIDSYCYLKDVITKLRKKDYANLEQLLPDIWLKNQPLKL